MNAKYVLLVTALVLTITALLMVTIRDEKDAVEMSWQSEQPVLQSEVDAGSSEDAPELMTEESDASVGEKTPVLRKVSDFSALEGKWVAASGEPLPRFEMFVKRPDSKTPYNFRFSGLNYVEGGCGLYDSGESYCMVHDADNRDVPRRVAPTYSQFESSTVDEGRRLWVSIKGVMPGGGAFQALLMPEPRNPGIAR